MNTLYDKGLQKFAEGGIPWLTANIKAVLVDVAGYTFSQAHEFLSDIPSIARVATSPNMTGKSTAPGGWCDVANYAFVSVTGAVCEAIVYFMDTGNAATSPLIAYIDTAADTLPVTPTGGDIHHVVPASGLFKL